MPKMMPGYKGEVRKRIISAGFEVMCEKSYCQTTMDDIANRLGVSKPALYRYFKNKDELVVEVSKNFKEVFQEKARSMPPTSGPLDAWNALFDLYMGFDERLFALYFELLSMTARNPEIKKAATENLMEGFDMSMRRAEANKEKGIIPPDADPYAIALMSMSLFLGMRGLVLLGIDREEIHKRWNDMGRAVYRMKD